MPIIGDVHINHKKIPLQLEKVISSCILADCGAIVNIAFQTVAHSFFSSISVCLFFQFAEKYGNVLSIQILGIRIVVLIGYKTVKEFYAQGDSLTDRPILPIFYDIFVDKD